MEGVGWGGNGEAGRGQQSGTVGNGEPADGANKIAGGSGVDDGALREPVRRRTTDMDSGVKGRDVGGEAWARNGNDENTERVGAGEQLDSLEGAEEPGQGGGRRVNETGSWEGKINAMDWGQSEVARRGSRDRSSGWREDGMLVQGTAKINRSVQAGAQLSAELSCAGDKSGDRGRQQRSDQRQCGSSGGCNNGKDMMQRV